MKSLCKSEREDPLWCGAQVSVRSCAHLFIYLAIFRHTHPLMLPNVINPPYHVRALSDPPATTWHAHCRQRKTRFTSASLSLKSSDSAKGKGWESASVLVLTQTLKSAWATLAVSTSF